MRAPLRRVLVVCPLVLVVLLVATVGAFVMPAVPAWAAPADACDDGVGGDPADEKKLRDAQRERQEIQEQLAQVLETDEVLSAEIEVTAEEVEELQRKRALYDEQAGAANAELASRARRSYMLSNSDPILLMLSATDVTDAVEQSRVLNALARGSKVDLEHASSAEERMTAAAQAAERAAAYLADIEARYDDIVRDKRALLEQSKETESRLAAKVATQRAANGSTCPLPAGQLSGGLACPVDQPRSYSDTWGASRSGGRSHMGVDIIAPSGTPLRAYESGTISRMGSNSLGGITLYLKGNSGNQYYYAHLSRFVSGLSPGDKVTAGQHIAFVGASGNARGINHLHWEVKPGGGANVNPYPFASQACG